MQAPPRFHQAVRGRPSREPTRPLTLLIPKARRLTRAELEQITSAGAFAYYVEYDAASGERKQSEPGYFVVDPILRVSSRTPILDASTQAVLPVGQGGVVQPDKQTSLPLDGLVIQTVIAKWMGSLSDWAPHLDTMRDRGYNMIHYTPLQQRGESNSPYSILDQNEFSEDLFEADTLKKGSKAKTEAMKDMLAKIRKQWGMLGMIDVVLNHTANNSPWLEEHPEAGEPHLLSPGPFHSADPSYPAGYSVESSPHLAGAVELDDALLDLSRNLGSLGLPTELTSAADLDAIMDHIEHKVLPSLRLYEFYALDVAGQKTRFREAWAAATASGPAPQGQEDLTSLSVEDRSHRFAELCLPPSWNQLGKRWHAQLDLKKAVAFIAQHASLTPGQETADQAADQVGSLLDVLNVERYREFDEDKQAILDNTRNRVTYTRLEANGPKLGPITEK